MIEVSSQDKSDLRASLWKKLDTLAQRDCIEESDARQWIDYVVNLMPDSAMWHMVRAGGIGGSEIGGLVRNYLGYQADHSFSAHDWALSKLLRKVPSPAQGVMQRGHDMEPIHAQRLYKELGVQRDEDAFTKLAQAQGSRPWMRYSPDDLIVIERPVSVSQPDGDIELSGRVLVDYKAPTTVDDEARISFQYSCQLHQGAILCEEQGIELSGAMLSQFNWATWSLKNDFISINPELCDLIKEVGDHYWNCVMRGQIPDYVVRNRFNLDEKLQQNWSQIARRLAELNAISTRIGKEAGTLREQLIVGLGLEDNRLADQALVFPGALKISASASIDEAKVRSALGDDGVAPLQVKEKTVKYDTVAMLQKLEELGQDPNAFRKLTKLDPVLTFDALANAGLNPEDFMHETLRVTVDRGLKEQADAWFENTFEPLPLPRKSEMPATPAESSSGVTNTVTTKARPAA